MALNTSNIRVACLVLVALLLVKSLRAQYYPAEGSRLNYTLIGFTLPHMPQTIKYTVEIAYDSVTGEKAFIKNKIKTVTGKTNQIKAEVPSFGHSYTWRALYTNTRGAVTKSDLYHFTTLTSPNIDSAKVRMRIVTNAGKYKGTYVFSDHTKVLYNMAGKPVWFLPPITDQVNQSGAVRDLKLTPFGTITFLLNDWPYEVNYNGKILWQPGRDLRAGKKKEIYHHEFTRLENGHYMVMGTEVLKCRLNAHKDSLPQICEETILTDTTSGIYRKIPFGTVLEYAGNQLVWSWRSADLFKDNRLYPFINDKEPGYEIHTNAFFFDTKKNALYVSSKHYSTVTKVNYPGGDIAAVFGNKNTINPNRLFCQQHSCKITSGGAITVFNNNECNADEVPSIVMLQETGDASQRLKKIWEFKCPVTYIGRQPGRQHIATTGGNVMELADLCMFASACSPYSDIFIVNRDKKILWHTILEKKEDSAATNWMPASQYRASIIESDKELDKLLFSH